MTKIDLKTWPRAQHFEFFKGFSDPYFNITVNLNVKDLFVFAKNNRLSFFHSYLFLTLKAANNYQPMCLRIKNDDALAVKPVNASVVQLCEDESFRFSYIDYDNNFNQFDSKAKLAADKAKRADFISNDFNNNEGQLNTLHISVLPWLNFTSFKHATHLPNELGIPKLVYGEYDKSSGMMPLSIEVHHALMDGVHVAKFVKLLQSYFDEPNLNLG
ncbi:chloramphenicol acetyltransferase [Pseudoalteromonas sp. C2R02]|nr:chloramphenicol acetyltransferase [Pseudoalteromonas sp. C2R02]